MDARQDHKRAAGLISKDLAVVYASILVSMFAVAGMPAFLGAYVDYRGFSLAQAGQLAMVETLGGPAGALLSSLLLARKGADLRRAILACVALQAGAQVVSALSDQILIFGAARAASGVAAGVIFSASAIYISGLAKPDGPYAIAVGLLSVTGPLALWLVPPLAGSVGLAVVYLGYAAALAASLALLRFYPRSASSEREERAAAGGARTAPTAGVVVMLAAIFMNFACNGGVWVYAERIGEAAGVDAEVRGAILAAGMLTGLVGTLLVSLVQDRFGRLAPLAAANLVMIASIAWLHLPPGAFGYLGAIVLLNVCVAALTPYYLGALAQADDTGRAPILGTAAYMIGYGVGPGVLSLFLAEDDFGGALVFAGAGVALSLALTVAGCLLLKRPAAPVAPAEAV